MKQRGLVVFGSLFLFSCATILPEDSKISSSTSEESQLDSESISLDSIGVDFKKDDLIFSEFFIGTSPSNRAIEISNIGSSSISLSSYKIRIYRSGSFSNIYDIKLDGNLEPHSTYTIAYKGGSEEFKAKANQIDDELPNIGKYPMVIMNDSYYCDTIGYPGYTISWCEQVDLVRKNEYSVGTDKFEPYDWIGYSNTSFDNVGQFGCPLSEEELIAGPRLTNDVAQLPYFQKDSVKLGGGGLADVTVSSYGDGDTTKFNYPSFINNAGYYDGTSCRYQNIDTPETQHTNISAEPWGYAAADFTNAILKKATGIKIQSLPGAPVTETYDRMIAWVWAAEKSNPSIGDYRLVNHEIVKNGYSKVEFSGDISSKQLYKGISYFQFLLDAQNKAIKEGLRVHGQIDPNFRY